MKDNNWIKSGIVTAIACLIILYPRVYDGGTIIRYLPLIAFGTISVFLLFSFVSNIFHKRLNSVQKQIYLYYLLITGLFALLIAASFLFNTPLRYSVIAFYGWGHDKDESLVPIYLLEDVSYILFAAGFYYIQKKFILRESDDCFWWSIKSFVIFFSIFLLINSYNADRPREKRGIESNQWGG